MKADSSSVKAILEKANDLPLLPRTLEWAKVNSGTTNLDGLASVAAMLADAFSVLPGDTRLIDAETVEAVRADGHVDQIRRGQHLVTSVRPDAPVRLLLTGHMDTVFAADHPFQQIVELESGVLNGPGLADMKGGISVMLGALQLLEQSEYTSRIGYEVMINSDEEVGSGSSAALIRRLAEGKTAALTYEPALPDGTLAGERGGSGNFSVIFTGKSAHAGRNPDEGRNALVAAADMAVRLKELHREGLSVNPAKIDGGGPNNSVPEHAILRVNFRPKTLEDQAMAQQALDQMVADIAQEHDLDVHCHGGFGRPPKPIDAQAQKLFGLVKQCGADLGLDINWRGTGGVCDGNNIAACGVPVVDTMGVRGGAIHSSDEYMIIESLVERTQLSALTIMRIAEKGGL
ncbi:hydrolase [Parasphingorhabdus flavimaris]|uniref:Hydrolase n=1 Tax=Parasphingorhabdus flavimaris TaxID=266812 RepID=A0ABX2N0P7_9SPHN|nr:hydrolase [Parasphingorhabdus flavimaris]NVD27293.1 hydrolase [Parasphingorhabdus flavimaris]|tara:strand:+ start:14400 stop:15608 length:1209 start_codon:yes stop_codon:yes gene_type:complete